MFLCACSSDNNGVGEVQPTYLVNAYASPAEAGIVKLYVDEQQVENQYLIQQHGQVLTAQATARDGYQFTHWTSNDLVVSSQSTMTFRVEQDIRLVACFQSAAPVVREDIVLTQSSVAQGAIISATTVSQIVLTYDRDVMLAQQPQITLNDVPCTVSTQPQTRRQIAIALPALTEDTQYTLHVPAGTVIGLLNALTTAPELTLQFRTAPSPASTLVNPNATVEAQNVYRYLQQIYGQQQLSGVQSWMSNKNDFATLVYDATQRHPALAGYDFLYLAFSPTPDSWSWQQNYADISAAQEQWQHNGLVSYMWHWNVPNSEADYLNCVNQNATDNMGFYCPGANGGSGETSFDIREALQEGTWQHACILRDIEEVAGYLRLLQDAHIPVIFRPLHEAAGNYTRYNPAGGAWFWWGRYGAQYCCQLYRLLYDQLVNVYGLNNLIWVWTIDAAPGFESAAREWYPGDDVVDIVGADIYTDQPQTPQTIQYDFLQQIVGGRKMCTISECGNIPEPTAQFDQGLQWLWFMVWPSSETSITGAYPQNTTSYWQQVLSNSHILSREDMPSLK